MGEEVSNRKRALLRLACRRGWPAALVALLFAFGPPAALAKTDKVTIKRTTGGIPNITARSWHGAGYGYGTTSASSLTRT